MPETREANKDWADPRVTGFDNFTNTVHHNPGAALQAALSLTTPYSVCIVGASRGIGTGIARSYAKAGATTVFLAARNTQQLADVAAQVALINPRCAVHTVSCDIASPASVQQLAAFVRDGGRRRLDAVVVNSGYATNRELDVTEGDATDGFWERSFAVNTLGTYHVAHYMVPLLLEGGPPDVGGGRAFLVVGTVAALVRRGPVVPSKYSISKMAQMRLVEHVAEQFGSRGLFAAVVHPGAVATEMALDAAPDEEFKRYLIDDPELCGHFLVWLTSRPGSLQWLNGRFLSAKWDPEELVAKKQKILEEDLLKLELRTD